MEKFYLAIDNIPLEVLSKFPQFHLESFQKLKALNHRVKAKIRLTEKRLLTFNNIEKDIKPKSDSKSLMVHDDNISQKEDRVQNTDSVKDITTNKGNFKESSHSEQSVIHNKTCNSPTSNDIMNKSQEIYSDGLITPVQPKRRSQFQLKVPIKATISPEMSKKLEEMMERNRTKSNGENVNSNNLSQTSNTSDCDIDNETSQKFNISCNDNTPKKIDTFINAKNKHNAVSDDDRVSSIIGKSWNKFQESFGEVIFNNRFFI